MPRPPLSFIVDFGSALPIILGLALIAVAPVAAQPPRDLEADALSARIDEHPVWLALGHYRSTLIGRHKSDADPGLYLAPNGDRDPRAELIATLSAFEELSSDGFDTHAQCRYPARLLFLRRALAMDEDALPRVDCAEFEDWRDQLGVAGASLIYPEGFMGSPASMFGHTLLRLDLGDAHGAHDLLGHAIDFTANTGEQSGPLYLLKGIVGLYDGGFGVNPYHQQLRRYAEWENRDVWEYRLDLNPDDIDMLMAHLWELRGRTFPYLFFTKNCSERLIELLKVVRPELARGGGTPPTVVPSDTVRSVEAVPGLVSEVTWRPSPATSLSAAMSRLGRADRRRVRTIVDHGLAAVEPEFATLGAERQALILETAYQALRFAFVSGQISDGDSRALSRQILIARSRLVVSDSVSPQAPSRPQVAPGDGHGSSRVDVRGGIEDGEGYIELGFRPSYHDLIDPEGGYTKDMKVEFLAGRVRYQPGLDRVRLHSLKAVEVISISPWTDVFHPIAWRFETGLGTRRIESGGDLKQRALWRSSGGAGLSFRIFDAVLVYGLGEVFLDMGPGIDSVATFGPGAVVGATVGFPQDASKLHIFGRVTRFALGDTDTVSEVRAEQRISVTRNISLRVGGGFHRTAHQGWWAADAGVSFYF